LKRRLQIVLTGFGGAGSYLVGGQRWCPAGEVFEVVAVFIQALACELVHGQGVGLLFGGGHSLLV